MSTFVHKLSTELNRFHFQVYDALDLSRVLRVRGVKNVEDNQTVITGLKPKTKYAIRVRARNRAGSSNFTDDVFVRTRGKKQGRIYPIAD